MDILRETDLRSISYGQNHRSYVDSETAKDKSIKFEVSESKMTNCFGMGTIGESLTLCTLLAHVHILQCRLHLRKGFYYFRSVMQYNIHMPRRTVKESVVSAVSETGSNMQQFSHYQCQYVLGYIK